MGSDELIASDEPWEEPSPWLLGDWSCCVRPTLLCLTSQPLLNP